MRLYLQTMVRKSELQDATWDEVDFENAVWTIPKERMKRSKAHNVYLSRQVLDIFIALKTCAGNSRYVLPSRYDADAPMSRATFNRVTYLVVEQAKKEGLPLEPFTVHDLRRTGSTLLNELGFNSDWVEKCLAREERPSSCARHFSIQSLLNPSSFSSVEPVRRRSCTVNGPSGSSRFLARSTIAAVMRLNVARDIVASASYRDGSRYREFPAHVLRAIIMSSDCLDR